VTETRNSKVLEDFTAYCRANPSERFWQALRNWADLGNWILATDDFNVAMMRNLVKDTFYLEGRNE
jgi:hypothetical protein